MLKVVIMKQIYIDDDAINNVLQQVKIKLKNAKSQDGTITITHKLGDSKTNNKTKLMISAKAYCKMAALVMDYTTEVEWYATASKIDGDYYIFDVLAYPHEVTGTTVTANQEESDKWFNALDDDTLSHLRLHGHSHVNM